MSQVLAGVYKGLLQTVNAFTLDLEPVSIGKLAFLFDAFAVLPCSFED